MPYRTTPFANGEFYHVYNRGVASQPIFSTKKNYERFLLTLSYYRFSKLQLRLSHFLQIPKKERDGLLSNMSASNKKAVNIISYCLMPNHYHLLIQQLADEGITKFMKLLSDSYTRYYNAVHKRIGPVFQGTFKAVHIESDEQIIHVSRYIHLNPLVSFIVKDGDFFSYPWASLYYFQYKAKGFVDPKPVLKRFKNRKECKISC